MDDDDTEISEMINTGQKDVIWLLSTTCINLPANAPCRKECYYLYWFLSRSIKSIQYELMYPHFVFTIVVVCCRLFPLSVTYMAVATEAKYCSFNQVSVPFATNVTV